MVSVIYRSPSQTNDEVDTFLSNFQMLLNDINNRKPSLSVVTGDFNSRCSSWWSNDINTTEGLKLLTVCSYHVTYAFQSESTLYSCLNVKELLARSRREILKFK